MNVGRNCKPRIDFCCSLFWTYKYIYFNYALIELSCVQVNVILLRLHTKNLEILNTKIDFILDNITCLCIFQINTPSQWPQLKTAYLTSHLGNTPYVYTLNIYTFSFFTPRVNTILFVWIIWCCIRTDNLWVVVYVQSKYGFNKAQFILCKHETKLALKNPDKILLLLCYDGYISCMSQYCTRLTFDRKPISCSCTYSLK